MSDQDFFFDEDEKPAPKEAPAAKPAPKPGPKPAGKPAPAQKAAPASAPARSSSAIEITWTVAALIAVVALLLGVIVGYAIPKGSSSADTVQTTTAPQLSPQQLQSGQLPPGHPDIGGAGASSGATGSATTTTGK